MGKKTLTVCYILAIVLIMSTLAHASGQQFYEAMASDRETTAEDGGEIPTEEPAASVESTTENSTEDSTDESTEESTEEPTEALTEETTEPEPWVYFRPEGTTLLTRVMTPEGYERAEVPENSFADFVLNYPLKEHGAPILMYDGTLCPYQHVHTAVFNLPIENEDFQQCADSVMRIFSEYYWHTGQQDRIAFRCTTGFLAEYTKWRDGYRFLISGDQISWEKRAEYDDSYENFTKYLRMVFAYAGTLSMDIYESYPITLDELQIGDVWLEGASPGHVMMVVDICYDENGRKAFLLADGHTPAMDFHLMKNFAHEEDPWFYEDEISYPLVTFAHTYMKETDLQRLTYPKLMETAGQ